MAARDTNLVEQSLEDATVALINSDPELREELRELIKDAVQRYRHVIRWGQPDARLAAIKAIVPGLLRAMGRIEQSDQEKQMHDVYTRLLAGSAPPPSNRPKPEADDAPAATAAKKPRARAKKQQS